MERGWTFGAEPSLFRGVREEGWLRVILSDSYSRLGLHTTRYRTIHVLFNVIVICYIGDAIIASMFQSAYSWNSPLSVALSSLLPLILTSKSSTD